MYIIEDLYTTTFSNNESFFKKAAAEIESLRAQIAELKAKNERLQSEFLKTHNWLCDRNEELDELARQRDEAVRMLADWCDAVRDNGTGWDDWDEHYKDAAWRQCGIRELIDAARTTEGATE